MAKNTLINGNPRGGREIWTCSAKKVRLIDFPKDNAFVLVIQAYSETERDAMLRQFYKEQRKVDLDGSEQLDEQIERIEKINGKKKAPEDTADS